MSCNITIAVAGEGVVYPCAFGRPVGWAEEQIRKRFGIKDGSIDCDGVGADEGDIVEDGKTYSFVGGSIQCKNHDQSRFALVFYNLSHLSFSRVESLQSISSSSAVAPPVLAGSLSDADVERVGAQLSSRVLTHMRPFVRAVNSLCSAHPVSTASDRVRHHDLFKDGLVARYNCSDPTNPTVTRCMLLGVFFCTSDVKASHIVGLYEQNVCETLGIDDVWDERNGLLLYKSVGKQFEAMGVVGLFLCNCLFPILCNSN
jgi:hypothetical protein